MAKRIYWESLKKYAAQIGITAGTLFGVLFLFLINQGLITNVSYTGDMYCNGTLENPCIAIVNFSVTEDFFLYKMNYDPYGRNSPLSFEPSVKSWKIYRSWGNGWREINLEEGCTGSWCGCSWCTADNPAEFAYAFREGRDYSIKIEALKNTPFDDVKWGFTDSVDPTWYGLEYIIDGDTVYFNDSKIYLGITKHIESASNWININSIFKTYSGNVDLIAGFNVEDVKPSKPQFWRNYTHNVTERYNISNASNIYIINNITYYKNLGWSENYCDVGNSENTYRFLVNYTWFDDIEEEWINSLHIFCFYDYEQIDSDSFEISYYYNSTANRIVEEDYYDWWNVPSNKIQKINYNYLGMNKWYLFKDLPVNEGQLYEARFYLNIPIELGGNSGKYTVALKPSGETIQQAIQNEHLYYIDPWWDASWTYCRNITLSGAGTDGYQYQVVLNDSNFNYSVTLANGADIRIVNGSCQTGGSEVDYWIEYWNDTTNESVVWFEATGTTTTYSLYYNNSGASDNSNGSETWDYFLLWDSDHTGDFSSAPPTDGNRDYNELVSVGTVFNTTEGYRLLHYTAYDLDATVNRYGVGVQIGLAEEVKTFDNDGSDDYIQDDYYQDTDDSPENIRIRFETANNNAVANSQTSSYMPTDTHYYTIEHTVNTSEINYYIYVDNSATANWFTLQETSNIGTADLIYLGYGSNCGDPYGASHAFTFDTDHVEWQAEASGRNNQWRWNKWVAIGQFDAAAPTVSIGDEETEVGGTPDINITLNDALSTIRFVNCSPDWEFYPSYPTNQTDVVYSLLAENNGTATGDFQVNLSGALNTGWTMYQCNDSSTDPANDGDCIELSTSWQTFAEDIIEDGTSEIWLYANCSYVSANPGADLNYQAT